MNQEQFEQDLRTLVIPKISFKSTPLPEALEWLRQQSQILGLFESERLACGVSILLLLPTGSPAADALIAWSAENVPLGEALCALAQSVGLEMRFNPSGVYLCPAAVASAIEACGAQQLTGPCSIIPGVDLPEPAVLRQELSEAETASWLRAAKRFPALAEPGADSRLHAFLQREVDALAKTDPAFFKNPNWPEALCERHALFVANPTLEEPLPVVRLPDAEPPAGFSLN